MRVKYTLLTAVAVTYMSAGNDYFCTGTGTGTGTQCTVFPTSESLSQIDISLGLIIAF